MYYLLSMFLKSRSSSPPMNLVTFYQLFSISFKLMFSKSTSFTLFSIIFLTNNIGLRLGLGSRLGLGLGLGLGLRLGLGLGLELGLGLCLHSAVRGMGFSHFFEGFQSFAMKEG